MNRIGAFEIEHIKRATVVEFLPDRETGESREIPFRFRGETGKHGERLTLYMSKEAYDSLESLVDLLSPDDKNGNTYIFTEHKENVYTKEEDVSYEQSYRRRVS